MAIIPTPLTAADHAAGYWWELSMRQVETSRTLVFDAPRQARGFFEALVADNLDLGRPDEVQLTFGRKIRSDTQGEFATKVVTRGVDVIVNVFYKHSRIKEYLKEGRARRTETVCNSPTDLGCKRRLHHLPELQVKARAANRRLLTIQRAGQACAVSTTLFERVALPSVEEGQRTGALRFGDPRTMALVGALCIAINTVAGFTNRSLRTQVAGLLATTYTASQMTYDLRRLRRKGLIQRLSRSNTYVLTPDGTRVAIFYTKIYGRLLRPLLAVDHQPASTDLRRALRVIDTQITTAINSRAFATCRIDHQNLTQLFRRRQRRRPRCGLGTLFRMSTTRPSQMPATFEQAFNSGDIEQVMALYEPDAVLVPEPGQVVKGTPAVREALLRFLALKLPIHLERKRVLEHGDVALVSSSWSLKGTGPDGSPIDLGGHTTEVIRRQPDGTWRYVIDDPFSVV
jgi:uncharacterized protein (TIGR02246 family)